jgi:uncharacterized protein YdbL (DUF1318 family)
MMERPMHRAMRAFAMTGLFALLAFGQVRADALDAAKQAGQVGERADGMVGAVGAAPADLAQSIATINAQRLATYRDIAQKTGTPLDAVEAEAGRRLIAATPAGQYVLDSGGQWRRK